ncbi:hypothetical protein MGYG_08938 [Nannizzia gypsea CBS 118893]|uniref:Uncharacterized protein n=1 Tax=Arthroderma gypseum (strain ATCC MYA-4604 / CBS 118893) TaxID=535722 RepID=E5R1T6_ARTGP|nr:hypothetical protein MGYG_08938 [Nannizzia gypsea CBS 118893]EFQ98570.1 hypothetical protein MGYG_08938 [Nannizzia gypsea CBS 118893]
MALYYSPCIYEKPFDSEPSMRQKYPRRGRADMRVRQLNILNRSAQQVHTRKKEYSTPPVVFMRVHCIPSPDRREYHLPIVTWYSERQEGRLGHPAELTNSYHFRSHRIKESQILEYTLILDAAPWFTLPWRHGVIFETVIDVVASSQLTMSESRRESLAKLALRRSCGVA